jgi:hypothetical protein
MVIDVTIELGQVIGGVATILIAAVGFIIRVEHRFSVLETICLNGKKKRKNVKRRR